MKLLIAWSILTPVIIVLVGGLLISAYEKIKTWREWYEEAFWTIFGVAVVLAIIWACYTVFHY